ncbi:hypothetical protein [Roseibium sp. M-1]
MTYLAIVAVADNRVSKFQPFVYEWDADTHVAEYGGFVFNNEDDHPAHLLHVEGQSVTKLEPPAPELPSLTARQFRLGLLDAGRTFAQVGSAIAAIEDEADRAEAEVEWEYAATFDRTHPLVVSLSAALGFIPDEVDALWQAALQL